MAETKWRVDLTAGVQVRVPRLLLAGADAQEAIADALVELEDRLRAAGFETTTEPEFVAAQAQPVRVYPRPGGRSSLCRYCGSPIWWARGDNGRPVPVDHDGAAHRAACSGSRPAPAAVPGVPAGD